MRIFSQFFFLRLATLLGTVTLSGCALNVLEYATPENANRIFDNAATLPTAEKDFTGFVQVGDNIDSSRITLWMEKRCGEIAGGGYTVGGRWKGTAGPHSTPHYYRCVPPKQSHIAAPSISVTPTIYPVPGIIQRESASFSESKSKCIQLGFLEGTEGFGKCVLQLTK